MSLQQIGAGVGGEFYEIAGPDPHLMDPTDWKIASGVSNPARHFLFYFRDNTFECVATDWAFERVAENALVQRLLAEGGRIFKETIPSLPVALDRQILYAIDMKYKFSVAPMMDWS